MSFIALKSCVVELVIHFDMDKWSKKKASETCGGIGMAKHIDDNEARRISRLKSIKSSIGTTMMSHKGWQAAQTEKRRKEQRAAKKRAAKKKPIGTGIQVDTSISKADAVTKCGLKLKETHGISTSNIKPLKENKTVSSVPKRQPPSFRRRISSKKKVDDTHKEEAKLPLLEDGSRSDSCCNNVVVHISENSRLKPTKQFKSITNNPQQVHSAAKKSSAQTRVVDDKENSSGDNSSNNNSRPQPPPSPKKATVSPPQQKQKKYFMDLASLRREHADALKMLQELDREEADNRGRSDSNQYSSVVGGNNNSSYDGGIMRHNDNTRPYDNIVDNSLDDEFVRDCSDRSTSISPVKMNAQARSAEGARHTVTDSFLNMTHLSISLRDDFGFDDDRSGSGDDRSVRPLTTSLTLTPPKNRSLTWEGLEDACDFFGDADVDSYYSSEESSLI